MTPSSTRSPQPVPFQLGVSLFNSAGERVRVLYNGQASSIPLAISTGEPLLVPGINLSELRLGVGLANGSQSLSWDGANDSGQFVEGGSYYFKLEFKDPFGKVTTFIESIEVVEPYGDNVLSIFNSSGELVLEQSFKGLPAPITGFSLESESFVAALDASGAAYQPLRGSLVTAAGASLPWAWAGRNQRGEPLSSGVYTLRLVQQTQGETKVLVRKVTLIDGGSSSDPAPRVYPNPAQPSSLKAAGGLWVSYDKPLIHGQARASLYSLSGELVSRAGDPGASGRILLPAGQLAPGVYIMEFECQGPDQRPLRRVRKLALIQ